MARALVTGVSGFAGSHLALHLLAAGDLVAGVCRDPARAAGSLPEGARRDVRLVAADVLDAEALARAVSDAQPERVYHLAGRALPKLASEAAILDTHRTNYLGTLHLLRAVRAHAPSARVLVVSSAHVYGRVPPEAMPIAESAPLQPSTSYGASKAAQEVLAIQAHAGDGLHVVRARAFNHAGARQKSGYVVPDLARQVLGAARSGAKPAVVRAGDLAAVRDISSVRDVVKAYRALLEVGEAGEVYNVCSGAGTTIGFVLARLLAIAGVEALVEPAGAGGPARSSDLPVLVGDPARLERATGLRLDTPLDAVLEEVLADWRGRIDPPAG